MFSTKNKPEKVAGVRAALGRTWSFLTRREKLTYIILVALRALSGLLDVVGIALIGLVTGIAATGIDGGKPLVILGYTLPAATEQTLVTLVIVVLAVFVIKALLAISLGRALYSFLARVEVAKSKTIAAFLFGGSLSSLQRLSKAEIQWATMGSTALAFSGLLTSMATFYTEGVLLLLVMATFLFVDPVAAIFVTVYFAAIIGAIQFVIGKNLKSAGIDAQDGNVLSMEAVNDVVDAFKEIAIFHKREFFLEKFVVSRQILARSTATINFLGGMPRYVVETALMLGVVAFVGWQFLSGQLATGLVTVGVFLTGGVRIMASLLPLQNAAANLTNQVEQARLAQDLLFEIAETNSSEPVPSVAPATAEITLIRSLDKGLNLNIKDVHFSYEGATTPVLKGVSMNVASGQHVAIIGPSGAGKTTVVDIMLGLIVPTEGQVNVGGFDPQELVSAIPGIISYVPQRPGLVSGTIAENVALGLSSDEIDYELVTSALEQAHLTEFIDSLPEGIHTSVGKQGDALSGGQIQRLGLARALYEKPRLIILDEATSALDAGSEAFISSSLDALAGDVTVIVIAHRLSTVQHSDVVYLMEDGLVTASGSFAELRKTVPMVAEYVKLMSFDEEQQD